MLTKSDLSAIKKVIREEVGDTEKTLKKEMHMQAQTLRGEIGTVIDKKLKPISRELRFLRKTINLVIGKFDERENKIEKRVTKIEAHIGLPINN